MKNVHENGKLQFRWMVREGGEEGEGTKNT